MADPPNDDEASTLEPSAPSNVVQSQRVEFSEPIAAQRQTQTFDPVTEAIDATPLIEPTTEQPRPTPRLSSDTEHGNDCLGVEAEVQAFARVICSRQTSTPLSIGLFGDWGSGKSFFIDRIQREIDTRGEALERVASRCLEQGDASGLERLDQHWHRRVAQITFNAWHYAEPNLWASLVTRIFDELAKLLSPQESVQDTRARLLAEVSESKQRRDQAQMDLRQAEEQLATALAQQEERQAALQEMREELEVVEAITPRAGTSDDRSEGSTPKGLGVRGPLSALRVTLRWVWSRGRWTRISLVVAIGLLGLAGLLALASWRGWIDISGEIAIVISVFGMLAGVASTVSAWIALIRPKLEAVKKAHRALREGTLKVDGFLSRAAADLLGPNQSAAQLARHRCDAAQIELDHATMAAEQATEQIARARRRLQRLDGGHRFYDFVNERDESDDYRSHLGLVSLIREDFERLEEILDHIERDGPGSGDGADPVPPSPSISRIVLYIDDLDRCEPERVVEVLQAVHLLLAMPIFVVVVAVDVRWLRRSLTLHYDRLLQTPAHGAREPEDEARPTPKNYLEKIFQIPFSLRPMNAEGFASFVGELLSADRAATPSVPIEDETRPADDEQRDRALVDDDVLSLDSREVEFMKTLHGLIDTPRLTKALVNTYGMLRAELPATALPSYLTEEQFRGVLVLLAIQVGRSREAAVLFDAIGRREEQSRTLLSLVKTFTDRKPPGGRWRDLYDALTQINAGTGTLDELRPWIDRIRRFSFTPRATG